MNAQQQEDVAAFIKEKVERAREVFNKGNRLGSAYLAEIAGMWTNALKRPNVNPYNNDKDSYWLHRWFANGYEDYTKAIGQTLEIRKKIIAAEKAWAEDREAHKNDTKTKVDVKKQTGKWNIKLW
jgi:hypothetical protein